MACRAMPITSPRRPRTATAAIRSMRMALKRAGMAPADIDYINAHGTSTPLGDEIELHVRGAAVRQCHRQAVDVLDQILHRPSARRGRGGGGDLLRAGDPRPGRTADHQSRQSLGRRPKSISCRTGRRSVPIEAALSNSFGFGGTNATLVLTRRVDLKRSFAYPCSHCAFSLILLVLIGLGVAALASAPGGSDRNFIAPGPAAQAKPSSTSGRAAARARSPRRWRQAGVVDRCAAVPHRRDAPRPGHRAEGGRICASRRAPAWRR